MARMRNLITGLVVLVIGVSVGIVAPVRDSGDDGGYLAPQAFNQGQARKESIDGMARTYDTCSDVVCHRSSYGLRDLGVIGEIRSRLVQVVAPARQGREVIDEIYSASVQVGARAEKEQAAGDVRVERTNVIADPARSQVQVWLTYYHCPPFCGQMANGEVVYEGAAACSYGFKLGERFRIRGDPTGRTYTCADRGLGGEVCECPWVDLFFWDAQEARDFLAQTGTQVEIVRE